MAADAYQVGNPLLNEIVNDYVGAATTHAHPSVMALHTAVHSTVEAGPKGVKNAVLRRMPDFQCEVSSAVPFLIMSIRTSRDACMCRSATWAARSGSLSRIASRICRCSSSASSHRPWRW